jgi:microcin C transport system permease protein
LDYAYETNYRDLEKKFATENKGDWLVMPFIPYDAYENDLKEGMYPPFPPSAEDRHYLGTDKVGRDVVARLIYGFRIAIFFSLGLLVVNYLVGVVVGCTMGYFGGWYDMIGNRIIEIWSNVPFLYVVIIISSIVVPNFWMLILIMALFGWMGVAIYLRTSVFREKAREYTTAAQAIGAGPTRVMFRHILPNTVSILITLIPFSVTGGMTSLTALDFLGFGLPAPTPSWGELLAQGTDNLDARWIVVSVVAFMVVILTMVTFIGEAVREAFDPRKYTVYR